MTEPRTKRPYTVRAFEPLPLASVDEAARLEAIYAQLDPAPKQQRARDTVRRLVEAADRLIAETGYDRFTTADVVAEAGMAIGIFYRYFDDRVHLLDLIAPDRYTTIPPALQDLVDAAVRALAYLPAPHVGSGAGVAAHVLAYHLSALDERTALAVGLPSRSSAGRNS